MPFEYNWSGLNNVAEYMASGLPFATASTATATPYGINFPWVTKFFTVNNTGGTAITFSFTVEGNLPSGSNYFTVAAGESYTADIRIKTLYVAGSDTYEVLAGLTQIDKKGYPILSGSGISGSGNWFDGSNPSGPIPPGNYFGYPGIED